MPQAKSQPSATDLTATAQQSLVSAADNLRRRQQPEGHWTGDYGGPLFLLPGLLIAYHITGVELTDDQRKRMIAYLTHTQGDAGGWGLHIADEPTVFGTTLCLVALRLLGLRRDEPPVARARRWLLDHGGAEGIPTWGKFWLAVLGVYRWEGVSPLSPELWLLPRRLPLHPSNFWCHTRAVFLPMSYIYGRRLQGPETALVQELRAELFTQPWDHIDWPSLRERISPTDLYAPHSAALRVVNRLLSLYEQRPNARLRAKALAFVLDQIVHEDESSSYMTIGPVSKPIHLLVRWFAEPNGAAFRRHLETVDEPYLWDAADGLKMQGYPYGSQCWDTCFATRALAESEDPEPFADILRKAHQFIDANQVPHDVDRRERYFRSRTQGMWPFSVAAQFWPVSDCTAEGLQAALAVAPIVDKPLADRRLCDAVDRILDDQNPDGGWSEYERSRAPRWVEQFNAAEVFGDIMRGYSYVECTSACIQGLAAFRSRAPGYRRAEIVTAIHRGADFIRRKQRPDGSWYGGWGVCFSYGTWFGVEGLISAGEPLDSSAIRRACQFLLEKQHADGGWGESYRACVEKRWIDDPVSRPVQTAWALLGLIAADQPGGGLVDRAAIDRGVDLLCSMQLPDGSWQQETIVGVFNRNCMITYENYQHIMPTWALARYAAHYVSKF
jgi:lanosterol synthase